jgi:antibiotic biosynthesis monooxygenase (ABM) superfamily enzyme
MAPRWKTAVITGVGLYPLVVLLFPLLASLTEGLPGWLSHLVTVGVAIPLMTWVIVPALAVLFRRWLHPAGAPSRGTEDERHRPMANGCPSEA